MEDKSKKVELTCICCPVGCSLTVTVDENNKVTVTGNKCPNGAAYGEKEVTNPTRIVTSTVKIKGKKDTVIGVKTAMDIPKGKIMDVMEALRNLEVSAPVSIGDVIVKNVAGTGVDIVATRAYK